MNAQITSPNSTSGKSFLQRTLLGNAVFSGMSGLVMVVAAGAISQFLGLSNPLILVSTGIALLVFMSPECPGH